MKFILILIYILLIGLQNINSQNVVPAEINVIELEKYEASHPDLLKHCSTCSLKEKDVGWKNIAESLPIPLDAIIKNQVPAPKTFTDYTPLSPFTPLAPSPIANKNFLGHVDPGQGIPPDTHGAVGIDHIVTATNDFLRIHNKSGTVLSTVSITSFAGVSNTCDPYIKFDPVSKRFFYTAIDCSGENGNKIAILVSKTSDPTGSWFRYTFTPNSSGGPFFLDHPYLGLDDRWLVVSGRKFLTPTSFGGSILFLFDKSTLLTGEPISFGINAQIIEKTPTDGDAPLPVTVFGNNPNPGTFYILQNWNGLSAAIRLSTVTGNIPNATWNTTGSNAVFPVGGSAWTSQTGSIAEQLEESRKVSTNDARISTGVMVNGNIWCAHHIGISANNVAVQWWQLNGTAGNSFGNILQRGRIGAGQANNYRWFPSIAVNDNEDVMIGYSVSSNTSRISAAYSFRSNTTAINTTNDEYIYKLGLSTYYKDFGGSRARWGDYSHSALDPVDGSLWTIQEYADQRTGSADNNSKYGVWWAQVVPTSTLLNRDASIAAVIEPKQGLICRLPITPKIIVRNMGTDTLRSVQIGILLDGQPLGILASVANLSVASFNNSAVLSIVPSFTTTPGVHTLKVFTINPNGGADQRSSNDTTTVIFTAAAALTLPFTESFEALPFPGNGAAIINLDAPAFTWARTNVAGKPGRNSIRINCYDYEPDVTNKVGQRDIYRTANIKTSNLDSLVITFNVAYQQYLDTDVAAPVIDSLRVIYSQDCGVTWKSTEYNKGGASLASVATTSSISFVPTSIQWRTDKLVIKDFCDKNLNDLMVGFESVNGYGNNIYLDSINIVGFNSFNRTAIVKKISEPLPALCNNTFVPKITFGNEGLDTIKTLQLNYQIDNGPITTFNWSGALAKCDSVTVTLTATTTTVGTHLLKVYSSLPNGLFDQFLGNDTLRKLFSIYTTAQTPVYEGFEANNIPRNNWGIQNVNGGTTWVKSVISAKSGTGSLLLNNLNPLNFNGAIDYFISPIVTNSQSFDSVHVDFDLAYKAGSQYPGSSSFPLDTLEILATKDCGASFISIWKKWGNELQTVNDPNYTNTSAFVPKNSIEWNSKRIYLSPLIGSDNFQLYFAAKSNKQNNIWLDNINITSQILPQRLKNQGYLIYPNPFNNSFLIHHYAIEPPVNLKSVQVFNAAAQLVLEKRYNGNADRKITVDIKNLAMGVYILKMIYTGKTIVERIIKN